MNQNAKIALSNIKAMRDKLRSKQAIMTAYEKQTISEEIERVCEQSHRVIVSDALADWDLAINKAKTATKAREDAKAAEINRWKPDLLAQEMGNMQTFVNLAMQQKAAGAFGEAGPSKRLQTLFEEAKASMDSHKFRAACEIIGSLDPTRLSGHDKNELAILAGQAKKTLGYLRVTEQMLAAENAEKAALLDVRSQRQELINTAKTLGDQDPENMFNSSWAGKALKLYQVRDGETKFYNWDDPEVTGVKWTPESLEAMQKGV